jgi:uncharacterized protein with ParB-like and HNH nuclease domain
LQDKTRQQHFLGPLVCAALPHVPGEVHGFQLIDGQQRLTTLSLLLAALRDLATAAHEDELASEITDFLINRHKKQWQRFKLVPRIGDREAFAAIALQEDRTRFAEAVGLISAYDFFRKTIRQETFEQPARLRELFNTIVDRLYLVVITIGQENPYEIFESLNSTGLPLEESDLIRNFIFMQLPKDEQQQFDDEAWRPYEELFDEEGDFPAIPITSFYRDFLMRNGTFSRLKATFVDYKAYYEENKLSPRAAVTELARFAQLYQALQRRGRGQSASLAKVLAQFQSLDAGTANPLLLNLLDRRQQGKLSEAELIGSIEDLASFVIRRSICGEQTGAYGKWFCEAITQLGDKPRENLRAYLAHRGWPDDRAFCTRLVEFPLYKREYGKCRVMLEAIEAALARKEKVEFAKLQIEHVMPQTIPNGKAGASWREMLGPEWRDVHQHWLHALGNLTLTGYNPNLSNKPYADKQQEFVHSNLSLNRIFQANAVWNERIIRERGEQLAQHVAQLWPRPASIGPYVPTDKSAVRPQPGRERRAAYWKRLIELLERKKSPWLPIKSSEGTRLVLRLPASDVTLGVQFLLPKRQFLVQLNFQRGRGKKIFELLFKDRMQLDAEFATAPVWGTAETPSITCTLENVTIRDPLDWLEQHEWLAARLAEMHRAFYDRLKQLDGLVVEKNPLKQLQLEYWSAFYGHRDAQGSKLVGVKPLPQHFLRFPLGRSYITMEAYINSQERRMGVIVYVGGPHRNEFYKQLLQDKQAIETELGETLEWRDDAALKSCQIRIALRKADPAERTTWPQQHAWLLEKLERLHQVFGPRVIQLQTDKTQIQNCDRDYWRARVGDKTLAVCDAVLDRINKQATTPQTLHYRRKFIDVAVNGEFSDLAWFIPSAKSLHIGVFCSKPQEWVRRFEKLGLEASLRRGTKAVRVHLQPDDFQRHQALVFELVDQGVSDQSDAAK